MNKYAVEGLIGEGAYGVVLRCRNKETGDLVAVKKFKESETDEAVRRTTLRELKVLRQLKQRNIVQLLEAFRRKGKLYLVFEFVSQNLLQLLETHQSGFDHATTQSLTQQMCTAVYWCHEHDIIHRDLKPENLLVSRDMTLKLCDFGFARALAGTDNALYTDYVATRWYRCPELLLSAAYGKAVDLWSVGCIMGEVADGQPLFPGDSEIDQLYMIQRVLGELLPHQQELFACNPRFQGLKFPKLTKATGLDARFGRVVGQDGLDLMLSLLHLDDKIRITAKSSLQHRYFGGLPDPLKDAAPAPKRKHSRPKSSAPSPGTTSGRREAASAAVDRAALPKLPKRREARLAGTKGSKSADTSCNASTTLPQAKLTSEGEIRAGNAGMRMESGATMARGRRGMQHHRRRRAGSTTPDWSTDDTTDGSSPVHPGSLALSPRTRCRSQGGQSLDPRATVEQSASQHQHHHAARPHRHHSFDGAAQSLPLPRSLSSSSPSAAWGEGLATSVRRSVSRGCASFVPAAGGSEERPFSRQSLGSEDSGTDMRWLDPPHTTTQRSSAALVRPVFTNQTPTHTSGPAAARSPGLAGSGLPLFSGRPPHHSSHNSHKPRFKRTHTDPGVGIGFGGNPRHAVSSGDGRGTSGSRPPSLSPEQTTLAVPRAAQARSCSPGSPGVPNHQHQQHAVYQARQQLARPTIAQRMRFIPPPSQQPP
eukprot:m.431331 g.431331  ORF g.431331 m.431331 type:complete len:706 (-) comp20243_c7_seq1:351-2468(-)